MDNLTKIRTFLRENQIDALLVSMTNSFGNFKSEASDICEISGFSGSNGRAIITSNDAVLAVDGRYTKQANDQTDSNIWRVVEYPEFNTYKIIDILLKQKQTLAISQFSASYKTYATIKKIAEEKNFLVKVLDRFPINFQKNISDTELFLHNPGNIPERIEKIQKCLNDDETYLTTDKSVISWIFGLRKHPDSDFGVLPKTVALIQKNNKPIVFGDIPLKEHNKDFEYNSIDEFINTAQKLTTKNISLDYATTELYFAKVFEDIGLKLKQSKVDFKRFESIKTNEEINNQKYGAELTSVAFAKSLFYATNCKGISEASVSSFFQSELKKSNDFLSFSFNPISAFGENTAIVHYNPKTFRDTSISEGLFLFDAGAHFKNSTTDMTRTIYIGNSPSNDIIRKYTMALKSLIQFSKAVFPINTTACQLDAIARNCIWKEGMDYEFGTGHGVGIFANVHESPRISKNSYEKISENMVITVEPGIYDKTSGIRLENMLVTVPAGINGFVRFETINFIPFSKSLIDKSLLDIFEIEWLNEYNELTYSKLEPYFKENNDQLQWLKENTTKI
ncbi:MAG: M24 family metallopeptidase [Alphaproteobacteria bacterium]|nr:M24 family metallopeptidase [Alphaproteobacteria bacterium]